MGGGGFRTSQANTDQSCRVLGQTVDEQISAWMRLVHVSERARRWKHVCGTSEPPATRSSPPSGRLRLRGFFYLSTGMRLTHESERFVRPRGVDAFVAGGLDVCRWESRARRNNPVAAQASDSAIYCEMVIRDTSSRKRRNNFPQKQEPIICCVLFTR